MSARIIVGDCRDVMAALEPDSVDAIVTDPPYELGFMGKGWDAAGVAFDPRTWEAALRVLKPGGHLLAFGGTRTFHRMAVAIEDAGFEIRDCLSWLYGSGFPKSLDVSKAIDKAAGFHELGGPFTDEARTWLGWGTALKPAWEPVTLARKPLIGTVAANVAAHGTGGLNIDACRIGDELVAGGNGSLGRNGVYGRMERDPSTATAHTGRWPANLALDEAAAALLDAQTGGDAGGPSRFFYVAKADRAERNAGLEGMPERAAGSLNMRTDAHVERNGETTAPAQNHHPTVKPVALMQWLVRLVTPPDGTVLDPFTGSGSTGIAADREGFDFIGIEQDERYAEIARRRIAGDAPLFASLEVLA